MYMSFRGIYLASLSALTLLSKLRFSGPGIDDFGSHTLVLWLSCFGPLALMFWSFGSHVLVLWLSCFGPLVVLLPKTFKLFDYLSFHYCSFERTR